MSTLKILSSGDWEISRERLPALTEAADYIAELMVTGGYDIFIYTGDLFRHFGPHEVEWARRYFTEKLVSSTTGWPPIVLAGNHDWRVDINELAAALGPVGGLGPRRPTAPTLVMAPWTTFLKGVELAFLPAPNRDTLGAQLEAQGPRERDAEISKILEATLVDIEGNLDGPLKDAVLFFHATVDTTLFNGSLLGGGLTWTIDGGRLSRWGAAIGGHIHNTTNLGAEYRTPWGEQAQILYTGTIIHDTHGQKAQRFRALEIEVYSDKPPKVRSIPLPTVVVPIEAVWTVDGFRGPDDTEIYPTLSYATAPALVGFLSDRCGVKVGEDYVDLKLRARMPRADLDLLPSGGALKQGLVDLVGSSWIGGLKIKREEVATHKDVLEEAHDAGSMDLGELFDLWLESSGLQDHPNVEAARILLSTRSGDWKVETNVGIKMLATRMVNFRQWQDITIHWEDLVGTTAVIGDNEAGKTNLVEGPLFAWYKKTPRTEGRLEGLKYELNRDADKGLVEHVWDAGGRTYLVRRAMERAGNGEVSCKTELFEVTHGQIPQGQVAQLSSDVTTGILLPIASGADADKKIIEIVGGYDFVVSTFYGTATQINKLIDATPARWHEIFIEALSLGRFEIFRKDAAKEQRDAQKEAETAEVQAEQLAGLVTTTAEQAADMKDPVRLADDITEGQRLIEASEATIEAHQGDRERLVVVKAGIELQASHEARLVASIGTADKELKRLEAAPAEDPGPPLAPVEGEPLLECCEKAVEKARADLSGARKHADILSRKRQGWTKDVEDKGKEVHQAQLKIDALQIEIKKIKDFAGDPSELPCENCGAPECEHEKLWDGCPGWDALARPGMILQLDKEIGHHSLKIAGLAEKIGDSQTEIETSREAMLEADGKIGTHETELEELEAERDKLRDRDKDLQVWELKRKAFLAYHDSVQAASVRLAELQEERAKVKGANTRRAGAQKMIGEVDVKIQAQQAETGRLRLAVKTLEAEIVKVDELHKRQAELIEQEHQASKRAEQLRAKAEVLGLIAQAFHASGIPFLLINRMVPAFQAEANRILATTHLSVSVKQSRPVGTGGDKKEVDELRIYFTDNRGTFPLRLCSGEQRVAVGLPLRASLAKTGAEFWGNIPEIFVQDEGWGAFHGSKIAMGLEMIRRISKAFQSFVYITHKEEMAEAADQVVEVVVDEIDGPQVVIT
jgi:DNA repair exonuclease SbcCD ATPase subunit